MNELCNFFVKIAFLLQGAACIIPPSFRHAEDMIR